MSLKCDICLEKYKILKYLSCNHSFCLICLKILRERTTTKDFLTCPKCREITLLFPNDENSLKTQFGMKLECESCTEKNFLSKCWWCRECEVSLCGSCAMAKHRSHTCTNWENYDTVKECASHCVETVHRDQEIHEFCVQLETALKSRYAPHTDECRKFLSEVESTFEKLYSDHNHDVTMLPSIPAKVLSTILNLIEFHTGEMAHNIDSLKDALNKSQLQSNFFSNTDEIIEKMFDSESLFDEETERSSSGSVISSTDPIHVCTWMSQKSFLNCVNQRSMCSVPDGLLIADERGIRKYTNDSKCVSYKGFSNEISVLLTISYRKATNSVFLMKKFIETINNNRGSVEEYSLPDLMFIRSFDLPKVKIELEQLLITILEDGRIICASGIDGCCYFWLLESGDTWKQIWSNRDLKRFLSLHLMKNVAERETLFVESKTEIYEFSFSQTWTHYIRCFRIVNPNLRCIMVWENDLYYLDRKLLHPHPFIRRDVSEDIHFEKLNAEDDDKVIMRQSVCGKFIYYLNCAKDNLYIGTVS